MKRPVLIIDDTILFPESELRMETEQLLQITTLDRVEASSSKEVLIVHPLHTSDHFDITELPSIALLGTMELHILIPNSKVRSVILGTKRVHVSSYYLEENIYYAEYEEIPLLPLSKEEVLYKDMLHRLLDRYIKESPYMSNALMSQIREIERLDVLTDIVASFLTLPKEEKKKYLYELNPITRAKMLMESIKMELGMVKIEKEIDMAVQQEMEKSQKEFLLREKLKVIQEELGDVSSREQDIAKMKQRLSKMKCPLKVKKRVEEELQRYENLSLNSPENAGIRDYLDLLFALPWQSYTKDNHDLKDVMTCLNQSHYGLEDVKERMIEYLAVKENTRKQEERTPILCLVGPPGVGKTSLAYSIAKALHRTVAKMSVGGLSDEAEIVGHRRTYIGAIPGRIIQGLRKCKSANPVFIIDEIDKMQKDFRGDPASCLLEVLDKEQNMHFQDHYLEEEFDLSKVLFITTANYEEQIPLELRDRLEIIHISSYTEYEKLEIAKACLLPKLLEQNGLTALEVVMQEDAILEIIRSYTKEAGVRQLERLLDQILRKIVKRILVDQETPYFEITKKNVSSFLGDRMYHYHNSEQAQQVGVVNGLAYTPFGGDTLPIEVNCYAGKGALLLTGSLGEVMQESARIALSYIKANQASFGLDAIAFEKLDLHIHLPEGAVQKEGPSAGIALTTALLSALSKQKISSKIAMTGEITLRGHVLQIGGVREKIIGAHRAGIKEVFLPKKNQKDVRLLPRRIQKEIKFHYVECYQEIYDVLFAPRKVRN